jgi:hypothetical protein
LSEGADQGLEEGVLTVGESSLDFLESGFNLRECNTGLKVLNDLGGFIDGFNLIDVFSILLFPGGVLCFSGKLLLLE